jgi:hypothetical protein
MADGIFGWKDAGQPLQIATMETPVDKNVHQGSPDQND